MRPGHLFRVIRAAARSRVAIRTAPRTKPSAVFFANVLHWRGKRQLFPNARPQIDFEALVRERLSRIVRIPRLWRTFREGPQQFNIHGRFHWTQASVARMRKHRMQLALEQVVSVYRTKHSLQMDTLHGKRPGIHWLNHPHWDYCGNRISIRGNARQCNLEHSQAIPRSIAYFARQIHTQPAGHGPPTYRRMVF